MNVVGDDNDDDRETHDQSQDQILSESEAEDSSGYDPDLVDDILSRHLLNLSFQQRTEIREEMHGVKCLAPEETPFLLEESLRLLQIELDINYAELLSNGGNSVGGGDGSGGNGAAYMQSRQIPLYKNSYINSNEFKLRFLRCELFMDVKKTASRIITFLDFLVELFGLYALEREIRITDFSRSELAIIRKGYCQFLPYRDNSGRRILIAFPNNGLENTCLLYRNKLILYLLWVAGKNCIDTQRKGIVLLGWFESSYRISIKTNVLKNNRNFHSQSLRVVSLHFCTPDTPFYRLRRATIIMRSGPMRSRLQMHLGEPIELQYALRYFGIKAGDNLPITPSGVIKTNYIRQWIRLRKLIESESNDNNNNISDIVECPYLNDVLLRQGGTLKNKHMGNMMFSNLIKINLQKECYNHQTNGELTLQYDIDDRTNIKTRKITNKIIDAIITGDGGGRFLSYSNEYKGWYHMTDREQIYSKVEYICRGSRFEMKKKKMMNSTAKLSASFSSPSNKNNNNTSSSSTVQQKRTTKAYNNKCRYKYNNK